MKIFWQINYFISLYLILILFLIIPTGTDFYSNNKWFVVLEEILTIDGILFFLSMIIEWIQFPLCLFVLIFWKQERTKKHFSYLVLFVILNLTKWIFYLFAVAGVSTK